MIYKAHLSSAYLELRSQLRSGFARGALGTFGMKITETALLFVSSILLTRAMGAEGFGSYAYAITWVNFLLIPTLFGLDQLLLREVAVFKTRQSYGLMAGILRATRWVVLALSICLALILVWLSRRWLGLDAATAGAMGVAAILIPIVAFIRLQQSTLRGLYHVIAAQFPEMIVQPTAFLLMVLVAVAALGGAITAVNTVWMHIIAATLAFGLGAAFVVKYWPAEAKRAVPEYQRRAWLASAWPLTIVSLMFIADQRVDTLILGMMATPAAVGVYTAASRGAELMAFYVIAVNSVLAPTTARLYANGALNQLQQVVTRSTRTVFLASLVTAIVFILFGPWYLSIFGPEFVAGQTALTVMVLGRLFNAAAGSVGPLLIMTGHERDVAVGVGIAAGVNVILNILLIPQLGILGAAIATSCGTITWDILLVIQVYRRLHIGPTIAGKLFL